MEQLKLNKNKKRILFQTEASYSFSGFGKYTLELLSRLKKSGKYEIAEFANYSTVNNPKDMAKWIVYPNAITSNDPRYNNYTSNHINQFGRWRFERVCLDFKPDIVCSFLDPWMMSYVDASPYRRLFQWCISPTCDSVPVKLEWLQTYMHADAVLTYSKWAYDNMKKESGGRMKLVSPAQPGVDLNIFHPINSNTQLKNKLGISPSVNLVGSVMRNQKRKLYPDLFIAFRKFLDICEQNNNKELAKKTFLYIHTSYPDAGWNIAKLLKETRISNKVYCTYVCKSCHKHFSSIFSDARTICRYCGKPTAVCPSTGYGITEIELAEVYQCMDLYIQYSICEGAGFSQTEASACGIPIMSVDYSAMSNIVRDVGGTPLKVKTMFRELETDAQRAYPDNDYCARKIYEFLSQSQSLRNFASVNTRKLTEEKYSWDNTTQKWMTAIDALLPSLDNGKWDTEPVFYDIPQDIPPNMSNTDFIKWIVFKVLKKPEKLYDYSMLEMLQALNFGGRQCGVNIQKIETKDILNSVVNKLKHHNMWEQARCGMIDLIEEDYIKYAHLKRDIYS